MLISAFTMFIIRCESKELAKAKYPLRCRGKKLIKIVPADAAGQVLVR